MDKYFIIAEGEPKGRITIHTLKTINKVLSIVTLVRPDDEGRRVLEKLMNWAKNCETGDFVAFLGGFIFSVISPTDCLIPSIKIPVADGEGKN